MRKRLIYLNWTLFLLTVEVLIGAFLRDRFIRPYVGDMLVTVLLCCLCRCIRPQGTGWLPLGVFIFSVVVECFQLIPLPALDGTVLGILMGSTFDWRDILCYGLGCLVFWTVERYRSGHGVSVS